MLGEAARGFGADALRGRIGGAQLGIRLLQGPELLEELVVLTIGDRGSVEDVVLVGCAVERIAQALRLRGGVSRRARRELGR